MGGTLSQLTIAELLGINPNVMVLVIDSLEKRRLVKRQRNPKNRREQLVVLTAKGRGALCQNQTAEGIIARGNPKPHDPGGHRGGNRALQPHHCQQVS